MILHRNERIMLTNLEIIDNHYVSHLSLLISIITLTSMHDDIYCAMVRATYRTYTVRIAPVEEVDHHFRHKNCTDDDLVDSKLSNR